MGVIVKPPRGNRATGTRQHDERQGNSPLDDLHGSDLSWLRMDGAMTKAPIGGAKTGANPTDRGKRGVKRSLLPEGPGVPLGLGVDGANRHAMKLVRAISESSVVARPEPRVKEPHGRCRDKGSADDDVREMLAEFGCTAPINRRGEEASELKREAGKRARRWVVERSHRWMKRFRRLLVRWDKQAENDVAVVHFACALIAFRAAGLFG